MPSSPARAYMYQDALLSGLSHCKSPSMTLRRRERGRSSTGHAPLTASRSSWPRPHCASPPVRSARRPTRACSSRTSTAAPGSTCCAWRAACRACRTSGWETAAETTSCSTTATTCCRPAWAPTTPSWSGEHPEELWVLTLWVHGVSQFSGSQTKYIYIF